MYNEKLLIITGSTNTADAITGELKLALPREIEIVRYCIDEDSRLKEGRYFAVFSSEEVKNEFSDPAAAKFITASMTAGRSIIHGKLDVILTLPREEKILLVNESKASALESKKNIEELGFDYLDLVPYYPGCGEDITGISIAITTGETGYAPSGLKSVYDLGKRVLDFKTVVKIMMHFGILEEYGEPFAELYINSMMDFARRISNVANEAGKIMKTIREELIGRGYFAKHKFEDIIGESDAVRRIKKIAEKLAKTDLTILLEGDNGTGKELFASAIHNASQRSDYPFIAINLSALPDQLVESELFGYEEGSFTGARKGGKIGFFQQANGGTIFLDEIGDISPALQSKLLRVIQEKEIMKIGGDRIIPVDVRIIAATNRNLKEMMDKGSFRKDLYYRLKVGSIHLSRLAERREDIEPLVRYWLSTDYGGKLRISDDAMKALTAQEWHGNVRELRNALRYAAAVCENGIIDTRDLPYDEESEASYGCGAGDDFDATERNVLLAVFDLSKAGKLAGRKSICALLEDRGCPTGEYHVRNAMMSLADKGLLVSERGKYGMHITPSGKREAGRIIKTENNLNNRK